MIDIIGNLTFDTMLKITSGFSECEVFNEKCECLGYRRNSKPLKLNIDKFTDKFIVRYYKYNDSNINLLKAIEYLKKDLNDLGFCNKILKRQDKDDDFGIILKKNLSNNEYEFYYIDDNESLSKYASNKKYSFTLDDLTSSNWGIL